MKKRIFALGESLIDIVFENDQPVKAVPGGSMFNAAVSLSRSGISVEFLGELFEDALGNIIEKALERNKIGINWSIKHPTGRTSLAIASLDENKNASYSFYHNPTFPLTEFPIPEFSSDDILILGSGYAIRTDRQEWKLNVLEEARQKEVLIYYDLNIRKSHLLSVSKIKDMVMENISYAQIVKGSDEDFLHIFGYSEPEKVYEIIGKYCPILIISAGKKDITLCLPGSTRSYSVPPITPVSTIGAGDNLNAGILFSLLKKMINLHNIKALGENDWKEIIVTGISFAQACCCSLENYVPEGFPSKLKSSYLSGNPS